MNNEEDNDDGYDDGGDQDEVGPTNSHELRKQDQLQSFAIPIGMAVNDFVDKIETTTTSTTRQEKNETVTTTTTTTNTTDKAAAKKENDDENDDDKSSSNSSARFEFDDGIELVVGEDKKDGNNNSNNNNKAKKEKKRVSYMETEDQQKQQQKHLPPDLVIGHSTSSLFDDDLSHQSLASLSGHSLDGSIDGGRELLRSISHRRTPSSKEIDLGSPDMFTGHYKKDKKISVVTDLETGLQGGGRRCEVSIRKNVKLQKPQSNTTRRRRKVRSALAKVSNKFWGPARSRQQQQQQKSTTKYGTSRRKKQNYDGDYDDDSSDDKISKRKSRWQTDGSALTTTLHGRLQVEPRISCATTSQSQTLDQYRLKALGPKLQKEQIRLFFNNALNQGKDIIYEDTSNWEHNVDGSCSCGGFRPNQWVTRYLHWTFRNSFFAFVLSGIFGFFFFTTLFAAFILLYGLNVPDCVHVNGFDFGTTGSNFMDSFALSWTTFSTVGYGLVFPATSATATGTIGHCWGISVLMTLEAFIGILFGSFMGAIVFAKVARAASHAQVTFSDPIVIKFGSGCYVPNDEDDDDDSSEDDEHCGHGDGEGEFKASKLPCPILEFRVLNRLHRQRRGEIIDASMNIVASIDERCASMSLRNNVRGARRKKGKKKRGARKQYGGRGTTEDAGYHYPRNPDSIRRMQSRVDRIITTGRNQRLEEDPSGKLIPKRIFAKLESDSLEHPFFKRLWMVRHVLDQHSPLLKQDTKELIRLNGGHWPNELNSAEGVRASIHFHRILVSFTGTSNVDANSVYAQHIYDYVDLVVGYRFCNILFRNMDGTVGVDDKLLNDVVEQHGGGGENLERRASRTHMKMQDIFVL